MNNLEILNSKLNGEVKGNFDLAPFTGYKIGGPAQYYFIAKDNQDVINAINIAMELSLPIFILARGSNVLVSDKGFLGLVIHNKSRNIIVSDEVIEADAGLSLSMLANTAKNNSLTGAEFAAGIPGSVGGAVRGNAGAWGTEVKDILTKVKVVGEDGKIKERSNKECMFDYRESVFKTNKEIILSAIFKLNKADKEKVQIKTDEIVSKKKSQQEFESPSSGCVFKNTKVDFTDEELTEKGIDKSAINNGLLSSGYLIDQLGLKGFKVGDAMISEVHANFIINLGSATAEQIVMLMGIIKQKVRVKYGVQLQEEIQLVGFDNY